MKLTNPRTRKSSSPSSFSQQIKNQTDAQTIWPKPIAIPYQAKIANFVNLIGHVRAPVRFKTEADGRHFTAVVVSPEYNGKNSAMLIPVVFEGDLAHVVAYHVKENDVIFVSGPLSVESSWVGFSENVGRLHVVAENFNFVQGLMGSESGKIDEFGVEEIVEVRKGTDNSDEPQLKSVNMTSAAKVSRADTEAIIESKIEEGGEKIPVNEIAKELKDGMDLWRDLLKYPRQWWDFRDHKANGLVKEKHPDFKHKDNGSPLWISGAPSWVLHGIKMLEFDVKFINVNPVQGVERTGGGRKKGSNQENLWRNFVENPNKWWDNRLGKRSPKAPDFKHKETGEALWLNSSPNWALSSLPPLKGGEKNQQTL